MFNQTVINIAKKIVDNMSYPELYDTYFHGKEHHSKYLIRDDAKKYTDSWATPMDKFINNYGEAIYNEICTDLDENDYYESEIEYNDFSYFFDIKSLIPLELLNDISKPKYNKRNIIKESADMINIDGYDLTHSDSDAIPFICESDFSCQIGKGGEKHIEIWKDTVIPDFREDYYVDENDFEEKFGYKPTNPITIEEIEKYYEGEADFEEYFIDMYDEEFYNDIMDFDFVGRLWLNSKIISFWKYPKDNNELHKIINSLEKKLNIKIWNNGWKILIIIVDDSNVDISKLKYTRDGGVESQDEIDMYKHTEKLIPLESYTKSLNPPEKEWIEHIKSPLLKKRKEFIKGVGSSKKIPGAEMNELPVETRFRLYKENENDIYSAREICVKINTFEEFTLLKNTLLDNGFNRYADELSTFKVIDNFPCYFFFFIDIDTYNDVTWYSKNDVDIIQNIENKKWFNDFFELNYVYDHIYSIKDLKTVIKIFREGIIPPESPTYKPRKLIHESKIIKFSDF